MKLAKLELLLFGVLVSTNALAALETLRCGNKLVTVGMTTAEVEKHCGKPSALTTEERDVRAGNRVIGTTIVQFWTYDRASGQNAAVLEFDQEKLQSIKYVRK
jgi:hypothetical protein